MSSRYHCAFVALVTLLAVILIGFLLLFTDLGFSPSVSTESHLSNGNIWAAKRLRVSAELAYYWGNSAAVREGERVSSDVSVVQEREGLTEKVTSERADLTSDVQSEMAEEVSSVMKGREVLTEKGEQDTKREHGNRQTQLTVGKSFRQEEELSRESFNESLKSSAESNTRLNQTSQNRHDATTESSSRTTATNNSERRKEVFVDLAATPAVGNTTAVNIMETLTSEEKQQRTTPYAVADDDDGKDLFSEVDDQYSLEDDSADDASDPYYAEDEDDSDEEINLAFENNIDKEKETNVHSNATQNHPLLGSIKPELERESDVQFHMPCPKVYHAVPELVIASWMKPLLRVLSSFEGKQVTLVIANNAYRDVLVNWLISARIVSRPPIDNILVVCLDHTLYRLLQSRDIPSILAPFSTVLNSKYRFRRFFELIMMMRLGFMRLINQLGYDCAMYDIDAIILKNPQPLYDNQWRERDIVGSRGELPRALWRKWGVAICIGVVFIRSNPRTELYWEGVYEARLKGSKVANDQIRLNYGLHQLHMEWEHDRKTNRMLQEVQPALGKSPSTGLSVVVLPFGTICRYGCRAESRKQYYIWHKGGSRDKKSKMKGAKQGHTWFLKERWSEIHSNMVVDVRGDKWLRRISSV